MKREKWVDRIGNVRLTIESIIDDAYRLHDYGLSDSMWRRGARFIAKYGPDRALELIDGRAERAFRRADMRTCMRWRDVMAAIHAISDEEPLLTDRIH